MSHAGFSHKLLDRRVRHTANLLSCFIMPWSVTRGMQHLSEWIFGPAMPRCYDFVTFQDCAPFKLKGRFYGGHKVCLLLFIWGEKSTSTPQCCVLNAFTPNFKWAFGFWGFQIQPPPNSCSLEVVNGRRWLEYLVGWVVNSQGGSIKSEIIARFFFWSKWPLDGVLWQTLESISTEAERDSTRTQWLPFFPALRCYNSGGRQ